MRFIKQSSIMSAIILAGTLQGCNAPEAQRFALEASQSGSSPINQTPQYDPSTLSCDPFGGSGPIYYNQGLKAELYYLRSDQPRYTSTAPYITQGEKLDADLFFGDLNLPTRRFSEGFPSQAGPLLQTPEGEALTEYFGLRYKSVLRLSPDDQAGKYQFAILSDDGSVLRVDDQGNGSFETWLDNDGDHASKVACASKTVWMDGSTRLPIELDFYQGPRYHIALMLLWREIPMSVDEERNPDVLQDAACGQIGNDRWFDYAQSPTVPKTPFITMLNNGWKVLNPGNYLLPNAAPSNPCCIDCSIGV